MALGTAATNNDRSLTGQLRSSLLSLREALFRHASYLEFLPAPERVDRKRAVQGDGVGGGIPGGTGDGAGEVNAGDELDPEVRLSFHAPDIPRSRSSIPGRSIRLCRMCILYVVHI